MSTEGFVSSELFKMAMEHIDQRLDAISRSMATKQDLEVLATTQQMHALERRVDKLEAATETAKSDGVSRWGASIAKFLAGAAAAVGVLGALGNWFHKGP